MARITSSAPIVPHNIFAYSFGTEWNSNTHQRRFSFSVLRLIIIDLPLKNHSTIIIQKNYIHNITMMLSSPPCEPETIATWRTSNTFKRSYYLSIGWTLIKYHQEILIVIPVWREFQSNFLNNDHYYNRSFHLFQRGRSYFIIIIFVIKSLCGILIRFQLKRSCKISWTTLHDIIFEPKLQPCWVLLGSNP